MEWTSWIEFFILYLSKKISSIDENIGNSRITPFAKLFFATYVVDCDWLSVTFTYIYHFFFIIHSLSRQNYDKIIIV